MKKINIDDLYFGVVLNVLSFSNSTERKNLKTYNLFDFSRVKKSVAIYVLKNEKQRKELLSDPLHFCFGDTWGRTEFEFMVCPWPYRDDEKISDGEKVDTWTLYVEPNADYLMSLVDSVSKKSAREYLKKEKALRRGKL